MERPSLITLLLFASVDLFAQTPGGVSGNLQLWLRAEGYTGGATWQDASVNARNATKFGTVPNTTLYNFQHVPGNLTNANYFSVPHHVDLNTNNGAISAFAVGLPGAGTFAPFVSKTQSNTPDGWDQGWILATSSPGTDLGFTTGNWNGNGSTNVAKKVGGTTTVPYIASGFGNGAWPNVVSVCHNGTAVAVNTSDTTSTSNPLRVGYCGALWGFDGGSIGEVIVYNTQLTAAQRQQVWSYLAIKYGITLNNGGTDYLSSASTTVWSTATNTGYNNNIFGIGRDNTSGLHQRQSISNNGGLQPVIANGSTLVALNSSGTDLSTDQSFLMAGHDNATTTFDVPVNGLAGANVRMAREWRVQETGTVGTVTVAWPDNDPTVRLLVSNDANFDGSDVAIATTAITINGTAYRQASVNFTNGQYFTFGELNVSPGGRYEQLALWLAGDSVSVAPGNSAPSWLDLSKNNNPVESVGSRVLQAADADHNFHPFFNSFSNADHFRDMTSSIRTVNTVEVTEVSMFAVVRLNNVLSTGRIMGIDNDNNRGDDPGLSVNAGRPQFDRASAPAVNYTSPLVATASRSSIFSAVTSGTTLTTGVNGNQSTNTIGSGGGVRGTQLMIGRGTNTSSGPLPGDLQEVIWFKRSLSLTERRQVESYLCLKHGITYGGNAGTGIAFNYLSSIASTIWDKSLNDGYNTDITGIGRDNASRLNQRQSTNATRQDLVTMALGSIATSNGANTGAFSQDVSYLIWGHDGGARNSVWNDPNCFTSLPTGVQARIQRRWKTQPTNFTQTVTVAFDETLLIGALPVSNLRLLVDDEGTNWTNATVYGSATSSGGRVVFSNVSFSSAQPFFTLGTINSGNTPLPVELVSFEGETIGNANHLTWTTATEQYNDRFEVERSQDSYLFQMLTSVPGAGNSQQTIHYAAVDEAPPTGTNYYRLRQVDLDGTATYSPVIALRNERPTSTECIQRTLDAEGLYVFNCTVPEGATIELYTQTGQPLKMQRFAENGTQEVDLRPFAPGIYFARVTDGDSVKSFKLLRP